METVNIRPGVNILTVLGHLSYKPWYALGEFVDNAVNSGIERNWNRLQSLHAHSYKLKVTIKRDVDGGRIVVRDNAAGIARIEYQRAFRTAELPVDSSGLSEFGMGMKSAGFGFSNTWTVRTKAIGEKVTGKVSFDLKKIVAEGLEHLPVEEEQERMEEHFTEITLIQPSKMPVKRAVGKIKEHPHQHLPPVHS
ncbi:MAG: ATP-binding protein [Flavobacteriales bacterium]|nr:ATP-binding protein [Flavobacteriales bacterium]